MPVPSTAPARPADPCCATLGSRLSALAIRVPAGARMVDVGCDHGYLPIALLARRRVRWACGIDRSYAAVRRARAHAAAAGVDLDVRCGDGLAPLLPGEADSCTIAGMGGHRVVRILEPDRIRLLGVVRILVLPHRDLPLVRRWVLERIGVIDDEDLVWERGRPYVVVSVDATRPPPGARPRDVFLGPLLQRRNDASYRRYVRERLGRLHGDRGKASQGVFDAARRTELDLLEEEERRLR